MWKATKSPSLEPLFIPWRGGVNVRKDDQAFRGVLRECCYQEMTPEEVIGHDGPITGGGKEGAQ